jgi:hypothetical protein
MVSGAIMFLSGAVLFAGGTIAVAVAHSAAQFDTEATAAKWSGAVVGLFGLLLLVTGFGPDSKGRT